MRVQPARVIALAPLVAMRDLADVQPVGAGIARRHHPHGQQAVRVARASVMSSSKASHRCRGATCCPSTQTWPDSRRHRTGADPMALRHAGADRAQYQATPRASGKTCWMMPGTGAGWASGWGAPYQPSRCRSRPGRAAASQPVGRTRRSIRGASGPPHAPALRAPHRGAPGPRRSRGRCTAASGGRRPAPGSARSGPPGPPDRPPRSASGPGGGARSGNTMNSPTVVSTPPGRVRLVRRRRPGRRAARQPFRVAQVVGIPHVREPGRQAQHPRSVGADEDRRTLRPWPARIHGAVGRGRSTAVEVDLAVPQQGPDDLHRLLEAADAVVEREAERVVLRSVPARPEAQDETPGADLVQGDGHLGQQRRVPEAGAQDPGADATRSVASARAAIQVQPSQAPSCRVLPAIGRRASPGVRNSRWSLIQMESKPSGSAAFARRRVAT